MKNKNKLTLKSLQQQLEDLKVYKANKINPKVKKVEQIVTQATSTHMKGIPFIGLHLISWLLLNLTKLPFIKSIALKTKAYYGKTSIWSILILLRKFIIIINAIIGVYTVFKITGIGHDTILANFVGMGYTYIEILMGFTRKLFTWFFELFDYKVIPNINKFNGNNTSWWGGPKSHTWSTNPMINNDILDIAKNRNWYSSPLNKSSLISNPVSDWSSWLWIIGGITLVSGLLFTGYLGYNYYQTVYGSGHTYGTDQLPSDSPSSKLSESLLAIYSSTTRAMNPLKWWSGIKNNLFPEYQDKVFRDIQNNLTTSDSRVYPFTSIDPTKPWFHRLRVSLFGETEAEITQRMFDRDYALRDYYQIAVRPEGVYPTGAQTPANVGLGLRYDSASGLHQIIQASSSSYQDVASKIASAPKTPATVIPYLYDDSLTQAWSAPTPPATEPGDPRAEFEF